MSAQRCALLLLLLLGASSVVTAETVTFTGTVLGPDEKPVAQATVLAWERPPGEPGRTVETSYPKRIDVYWSTSGKLGTWPDLTTPLMSFEQIDYVPALRQ